MRTLTMRRFVLLLAVGFGLAFAGGATAAEWPTKPVRMIVPFAAGGAADVIARLFSDALSLSFGQQFIAENRTGAGGLIGAQTVARADPDGYTLMAAGMSSHVLAPATNKNPGYDPIRDFTHVAFFGGAPSVILVHPSLGVTSFKELLAFAKTMAGSVEYVSAGTGTVGNLLTEYIAMKEKIKLVHVPYRSGNGAILDLLAGRVKVGTLNWSTAREHVLAGRLIPIGVSSSRRLAALPSLATLSELGYPDMVTTTWHMLAGPAGLPKEIVGALNREVAKSVDRPDLRRVFENDAVETKAMTSAELTVFVASEVAKWTPVVKASMRPE
jgi:tripartite-type tricarboxylate transporter receptor subunit TctC